MVIPALAMPFVTGFAASAVKTVAGAFGDAFQPARPELEPPPHRSRTAAEDFEAMFLENMLERVFGSIGADGPLGDNGPGGDVYRSMFVKEIAKSISRAGGIGLAQEVYGELLKLQEAGDAA